MSGFLSRLIQRASGQAPAIKPLVRSSYDAPPPMKESVAEFEETASFEEESHPVISHVAPATAERGQPPTARSADISEAKEMVGTSASAAAEAVPGANQLHTRQAAEPSAVRPQIEDTAVPAGRDAARDKPEVATSLTGNRDASETPDTPRKRGIEVPSKGEGGRHPAPVSHWRMTARVTETAAPRSENAGDKTAQPVRIEDTHAAERPDTGERDTTEAVEVAPVTSPGNGLPARGLPRKAAEPPAPAVPPVNLVRRYQPEVNLTQRQRISPAGAGVGIPPVAEASPSRNIRVTIGRVEIKAVRPPERPVQRAVPALKGPAVSLDAYLKGRDGEKP